MAAVPFIELNDGNKIPQLGLGTWKSQPGQVGTAVKAAIDRGYRHIDCAMIYGNEDEIGDALQQKISDGTVKREDLFITGKIWNTFHSKEKTAVNLNKSLKSLQLDYVDMMLIHWPQGYEEGGDNFPADADGKTIYSDVDYLETWAALETAQKAGMVKSIGLSNFNSKQIQRILDHSSVKPVTNQVEVHPYLNNEPLIQFCKKNGIVVTAYSPLGSPDRPWATANDPVLLEDPMVQKIGNAHKKNAAQVLIRFAIQRGIIVIPKSVTPSRIDSNYDVFNFELTAEEMEQLMGMNRADGRGCHLDWVKDHPYYPFNEEF